MKNLEKYAKIVEENTPIEYDDLNTIKKEEVNANVRDLQKRIRESESFDDSQEVRPQQKEIQQETH